MNITILTYGSRGDVQPFLALALGLQQAGHRVTLAAPACFEALIRAYAVECAPLAGDPNVISRMINDAGGNIFQMVKSMQNYVFSIAPEVVRGVRRALAGTDLLVHGFLFTTGGHAYACEMGIPDVSIQTFPMFAPTRAFPNVAMPAAWPGWLNVFSHWLATQIFWHGGNMGYWQLRRGSPADFPRNLIWPFSPSKERPQMPLIFAYSPVVLPRPADWTDSNIHLPGYFFLDHPAYQPAENLNRFLDAGEKPFCITFGSMVNREAEKTTRAVLAALKRTGSRGLFLTGWGGWKPEIPPDNALFMETAPHDWLFPRCRAIVHHGGAGTTAAGLRSGRPNIVVPHAADQPFWGRQVAAIGAGPQPIPVSRLSEENLAAALVESGSAAVLAQADEVGRRIRAENGVAAAVKLIEEYAVEFASWKKG